LSSTVHRSRCVTACREPPDVRRTESIPGSQPVARNRGSPPQQPTLASASMVLPRHKLRGLSFVNVALVAIVLAIAVTAYFLFFKKDPPAASATRPSVAVQRGEVTASVSSSGTLQSSQTASPQFETSGTVTQVLVK